MARSRGEMPFSIETSVGEVESSVTRAQQTPNKQKNTYKSRRAFTASYKAALT
jgi:hypothetical protein